MIAEERRALLIQELNETGYIQVAEIAGKLDIAAATIRRDLSVLEEQGFCVRKRGGAVRSSQGVAFEPPYAVKRTRYEEEKTHIAEAAVKLVEEGDTLILDAGSTTYHLALKLLTRKNIKVVTNDLQIAVTLAANPNIYTICTGGVSRPYVFSLQGSQTEAFISELHVDKAFIGADAIQDGVLANVNMDEVPIKRAMIQAAKQAILITDSSKFQKKGFMKVCDLTRLHLIITDRHLPADQVEYIRSLNIPLICS